MGRQSAVRTLPADLRREIDAMIREGRATIDDLVAYLEEQGAEVSRSAMGRYKQGMEASLKRYREAQEVAGVWITKLGQDQGGDVSKLLAEMLKTVAFQTLADLGDEDAAAKPADIMLLARAVKDLESSGKLSLEREIRVRQETAKQAVAAAEKVARGAGLTAATIDQFRAGILGVAAK